VGIFCFEGVDRLVDKFSGCESIPVGAEDMPSLPPFVSTALKEAAASAKECSLESSSGCGGVSFDDGNDLDDEPPRMTDDCEWWCCGFVGVCWTGICLVPTSEALSEDENGQYDPEVVGPDR